MKAIQKFKSLLTPKGVQDLVEDLEPKNDGDESTASKPNASGLNKENESKPDPKESTAEHAAQILAEREKFLKATGGGSGALKAFTARGRSPPHLSVVANLAADGSDPKLLGSGTGGLDDFGASPAEADIVSDSPTAVDFNIYERAFDAEVERIKRSSSRKRGSGTGTVYLTKLSERSNSSRFNVSGSSFSDDTTTLGGGSEAQTTPRSSISSATVPLQGGGGGGSGFKMADLVARAVMEGKAKAAADAAAAIQDQSQ